MPIDRIGGPSGVNPLPERDPKKVSPTDVKPGPSFEDTLTLTLRGQMEAELRTADAATAVNSLLGWYNDPANLIIAMSIIGAMEAGRREAIREEMVRRNQEAGMAALLEEFNRAVTTVSPTTDVAQAGVDQHMSAERVALEIAMRLRLESEGQKPRGDEKKD